MPRVVGCLHAGVQMSADTKLANLHWNIDALIWFRLCFEMARHAFGQLSMSSAWGRCSASGAEHIA